MNDGHKKLNSVMGKEDISRRNCKRREIVGRPTRVGYSRGALYEKTGEAQKKISKFCELWNRSL